jgi:putative transposase
MHLRRAICNVPTERAALRCLYMAPMGLDPRDAASAGGPTRWKAALNVFDIAFEGRLSAGRS